MLLNERHEETTFSFSRQTPRPPERRRDSRHLTILRVGALIGPQGRELCLIRNISQGGLMAHVYSQHEPGETVSLELKSNQQVPGRVVWREGNNLGIEFLDLVDVEEMLSSQAVLDNGWRPRMPRVEVDRLATVRCGAIVHAVSTVDISQGGVKVETDRPIEVGRDIVLTMERFRPLAGVVRWYENGVAGLAFNELIPFHELMAWLRPGERRA
ncbi:MAG TPA: PilZ domain-containing protein [Allosphingosinicella sp.]|jgi:hypothetical protein